MSNKTYDNLKFISLLIAPAVVFIASLVDTWGIPYGSQIVSTLAAVDVFFGAVVAIANKRYMEGLEDGE